jgi:hypothetical protein
VTTVASALVYIPLYKEWKKTDGNLALSEREFFLKAYEAIGVGFLAALLGAIIPHVLAETRDSFERFKDSRITYSRAKTSIIYLPEKLTGLEFPTAVSAIRDAHENLHLCETYQWELLKHLHWHPHPETWIDRNYWDLTAIHRAVDFNVSRWPQLSAKQRLETLQKALVIVENNFGPYNEEWWKEKTKLKLSILENILGRYNKLWLRKKLSSRKRSKLISKECSSPKRRRKVADRFEVGLVGYQMTICALSRWQCVEHVLRFLRDRRFYEVFAAGMNFNLMAGRLFCSSVFERLRFSGESWANHSWRLDTNCEDLSAFRCHH